MRQFIVEVLDAIASWALLAADRVSRDTRPIRMARRKRKETMRRADEARRELQGTEWDLWAEDDLPPRFLKMLVDQIQDQEPTPDWRERLREL